MRRLWIGIVAGVVLAGGAFCGSYHFVYGEGNQTRVVKKTAFSLSETFVPWDEILGVPQFILWSKHPLAMKALMRDGLITMGDIDPDPEVSERRENIHKKLADLRERMEDQRKQLLEDQ